MVNFTLREMQILGRTFDENQYIYSKASPQRMGIGFKGKVVIT